MFGSGQVWPCVYCFSDTFLFNEMDVLFKWERGEPGRLQLLYCKLTDFYALIDHRKDVKYTHKSILHIPIQNYPPLTVIHYN